MEDIKGKLRYIRHSRLIVDPFADCDRKEENIYSVYMKGYDKAYSEIEDGLISIEYSEEKLTKRLKDSYNNLVNPITEKLKELSQDYHDRQQAKIDKLKQLLLRTDPSVSNTTMNDLTIQQWNEFIKTFPDEA